MKTLIYGIASVLSVLGLSSCDLKNVSPVYIEPIRLATVDPFTLSPGQQSSIVGVYVANRTGIAQWTLSFKAGVSFLTVNFEVNPIKPGAGVAYTNSTVQAGADAIPGSYVIKITATGTDESGKNVEERSKELAVQIVK
jgi:hypothetical protein